MRLATWNVNGIRAREANVRRWLETQKPDFLLLQEIKCEAAAFPPSLTSVGYQPHLVGQKGFNGVAILARTPVQVNHTRLPGLDAEDSQARYIEVETDEFIVGNLYLPNGNSNGDLGYAYKLAWMKALGDHVLALRDTEKPFLLAGDYNVCPEDVDFATGALGPDDALVRPATRALYWRMIWMGLTDAIRALKPTGPIYTFWDYQAGCWPKDRGLRIDHALLSPYLAERLVSATPDKAQRGEDTPSDHVPVIIELRA